LVQWSRASRASRTFGVRARMVVVHSDRVNSRRASHREGTAVKRFAIDTLVRGARALLIGVAGVALGCGGAPQAQLTASPPSARAAIDGATTPGHEVDPGRYVVRNGISKLVVTAKAAGVGSQTLHFEQWRAWVAVGAEAKVVADIDMTSLRAPLGVTERI